MSENFSIPENNPRLIEKLEQRQNTMLLSEIRIISFCGDVEGQISNIGDILLISARVTESNFLSGTRFRVTYSLSFKTRLSSKTTI